MDNIRFYQCPPCSSPKKREHAASTNPDPTSRPFLEISLSREIANDHVEDGQAVTQGRLHKPATSFVSAIERQRIVAEEEIGLLFRLSFEHVTTDIRDRSVITALVPRPE